ncbi:filamentous hemagglutinin N-terminal domain-containing protein [Nostoc sp. PA-18-2419]|uniref:two-partner secretion domain-containing protein n=1 Tax=Nostoc sp. PA-18-2419 TaxID=2575443 RepID=UPI001108DDD0|nr:S-layer family protein [Nostoc sp. PA-18-2419]
MSFKTAPNWLQGLRVAIFSAVTLYANISVAQITPDSTLPNNSNVKLKGNTRIIEGGTTRGANLFHSFEEFSVLNGSTALFNNTLDIQNIISRVTGKSISNIDGLIKSNGTANVFLINPNGIIFGKNASLNIGGSFVGATANAIGFGNLGFFSASNPEGPSALLTVNPNALLFNQIAAAPIQNSSTARVRSTPGDKDALGLRVPDGRSLLLVGGNVNMDGGKLNAFGGSIELGGLASAGTVGLNDDGNNIRLSFPNSVERSDIFLSNGAQVNVFAGDGGSITVNARNLEMTGESFLGAGIDSGLGSNNSQAGNISINATGAINLNNKSEILSQVGAEANGQGGDISINASTLRLESGARVTTRTYSANNGGNISIDAQDVQLIGTSADDGTLSGLFAQTNSNSTGDAGNLTVTTNTLLVRDGARVNTSTISVGNGGILSVDAQDIQLIGTSANGKFPSGLSTSARENSTGNAGDLKVKTNTLFIGDGARINTGTFGAGKGGNLSVDAQDVQLIGTSANGRFSSGLFAQANLSSTGDAGDLKVTTNTLLVRDGAQVNTGTFRAGKKGGNLSVDAQDVQLIGTSANGRFSSGLFARANPNSTGDAGNLTVTTNTLLVRDGAQVNTGTSGAGNGGILSVDAQDVQLIGTSANGRFSSGLFARASLDSTGDAGDLTVKTNTLLVRDGARVTVQSSTTGTAGSMTLNARSIRLNNNASLIANTRSPKVDRDREQATINIINSQDLIMTGNSNITTDAAGKNVIGGNININADVLAGSENSNITAKSANFRGGNIRIITKGIFGIQFRHVDSPNTSDITATGRTRELSGNVEIIRPDINPTSSLIELPTNLVDVSGQISTVCTPGSRQFQSSFVSTGRGGLPMSPTEPLQDTSTLSAWVRLRPKPATKAKTTISPQPIAVSNSTKVATVLTIVEATGWVVDSNGNIELVAQAPNVTPESSRQTPASCAASQ